MRRFILCLMLLAPHAAYSAQNVIVVTLDGVRWQEVYRGLDTRLISSDNVTNKAQLLADFDAPDNQQKARKLMPFVWQTMATEGVLLGNQDVGSTMQVSNNWYISYPGYNELITGRADNRIDSNTPRANPNISFFEWLQQRPGFAQPFGVFASWDVFPAIFNRARSGLHINAGFTPGSLDTPAEALLNTLQQQIPSPWEHVRLDAFTYHYALQYLRTNQPRLLYIGLGESDDFAHDGNYEQYIRSIHRSDALLKALWQSIQSLPGYHNQTALLVTTDHGRGATLEDWQHHSSRQAIAKQAPELLPSAPQGITGSQYIWLAAIGKDIASGGVVKGTGKPATLAQVAATVLQLLGQQPSEYHSDIAPPMQSVLATTLQEPTQ